MKKLILVTLMAAAASWLLAETRRQDFPSPSPPERPRFAKVVRVGDDRPNDRGSLPTTSWRKGDGARSKRLSPAAEAVPAGKRDVPSWFPKTELEEAAAAKPDTFGSKVIVGRVSASEDRAKDDLRRAVELALSDWLAADVAPSWKVPPQVLARMVQESYTQETTRNLITSEPGAETPEIPGVDGLFTLYRAGQKLDFSAATKQRIVKMYRQDLAKQRMQRLGGGLALALVTLAVVSGYIKADEATKGYYTNRLRLVAAAGLGVAGVVVYRFLA